MSEGPLLSGGDVDEHDLAVESIFGGIRPADDAGDRTSVGRDLRIGNRDCPQDVINDDALFLLREDG